MITLTDKKGDETEHKLVLVADLPRWRGEGWELVAPVRDGDVDVIVWRLKP